MGDFFFATLDWPSAATWGVFVFAAGATALVNGSPQVARAWHQWRLDRRLARNPYILREELNEYRVKIDDELPPFDPHRLMGSSLFVGILTAIPAWLAERHLEQWWQYSWWAFCACTVVVSFWRRINNPPEMHPEAGPPEITVPREAWLGLVGGLAAVALIVLFITVLV